MPLDNSDLLRQARTLRSRILDDKGWTTIDAALERLLRALDDGDEQAVKRQQAVIREESGKRFGRGTDPRLGQPDRRPVSQTTQVLINKVIDRLTPPPGRS